MKALSRDVAPNISHGQANTETELDPNVRFLLQEAVEMPAVSTSCYSNLKRDDSIQTQYAPQVQGP